MRRWPLLSAKVFIKVRRSVKMRRRRLPLLMMERGRRRIVGEFRHYRFVTALHENRDVPDVARWFAGRLGALLLIVLRCNVHSGHESLSLAGYRLLLLTWAMLLLLAILRWCRHRALTALALLRTCLHVAAPLLLAYVHSVAQTVLRYRGRRRQVWLVAVRANGARAARSAATARLATRVLVHLMLLTRLSMLLSVVAATTGIAAPIATIA